MPVHISNVKRFLQSIAVIHIIIGLCFPWIVDSDVFDSYREHLNLAFDIRQDNAKQQASFLMAIFGPTIASWGVLFLFTVNTGFTRPSSQVWWFMILACAIWAPYDSIFSLINGIYFNAIINTVVFATIVVPLFMVRKHFFTAFDAE